MTNPPPPPPDEIHARLCAILRHLAPSGFRPKDLDRAWLYDQVEWLIDRRIEELRDRGDQT